MKNVEIVRKALASNDKVSSKNFRPAIIELLSHRDLTVAELVYALNGGEYNETLRRRVQDNVQNSDEIIVTRFEKYGVREVHVYSLKNKGRLAIDIPKRATPRKPIEGMEKLLTRALNRGLGLSVAVAGQDAIDAFKSLEAKQQIRYLTSIALRDNARDILKLVTDANLDKEELEKINVSNMVRMNATYVIAKVNKSSSFFDNIKAIYG
ncbi:hypothetical protein KVP40.0373 [Vibrio phage KVP40]|uniref:Uncharacterized protein n=2 Tax=Schizotequatrovirus KVP40 TaxID=1914019 RepID=Q6WHD2_BPKVM|nr:hypothetical protein KVP40.0373 [Vibrio phage KVP40]QIW91043.1 hypothetical protein COHAPHLL_00180 [Vibrio phage V09]UNA01885.1 hypothetical protein [Vibrio phage PC-Liy1]URQ03182.1 hypothetical protein PVA8_196 [Vibrio phage PVA8]WBM58917.1 hypothetical protein vBValMPVA8_195 [Vibrio phage vB_ValM_PVA8]WOL24902.1 hypothetical protein [Vibrio phage PG216]